ncbi:hypothetical protein [Methanococcus maripaludis]|uniref:Uncharacterized protein n=1 Tax=Methanococcus maripaludis TaxID=39152 RepID=A0A7J9PJJ9_METMI|nr:hypothetical protein [Methanococcus maripaludis]MBA2862908.1 hypothetical protein [Methanococcus maripaludis]
MSSKSLEIGDNVVVTSGECCEGCIWKLCETVGKGKITRRELIDTKGQICEYQYCVEFGDAGQCWFVADDLEKVKA